MTDFRDDRAIYLQMADRICDDILYGKYTAGARVPSVRELSVMLGVNANTVVRTYDALTSDGIIQTRRGLGYFVTDDARDRILSVRKKRFLEEILPEGARQARLLGISADEILEHLK